MMNRREFMILCGLISIVPIQGSSTDKTLISVLEGKIEDSISGLDKRYNYNENSFREYKSWIEKTIEKSKSNASYAIVIDKAAYSLCLYEKGNLISTFPVELGGNPYDDKIMEGDNRTPEGFYEVILKKDKGQSVFYKAFLINYPNEKDKKEFLQLKKEEKIPANAKIGGEIEIHGAGSGKPGNKGGYNWTLGCIALSNDDIDKIYDKIKIGTSITIVKYVTKKKYD